MLRCVALVITDVWEELSASFNRVKRIGELGTDAGCEEILCDDGDAKFLGSYNSHIA
jgi:hypothetical protein